MKLTPGGDDDDDDDDCNIQVNIFTLITTLISITGRMVLTSAAKYFPSTWCSDPVLLVLPQWKWNCSAL